jgi:hypothetical protein
MIGGLLGRQRWCVGDPGLAVREVDLLYGWLRGADGLWTTWGAGYLGYLGCVTCLNVETCWLGTLCSVAEQVMGAIEHSTQLLPACLQYLDACWYPCCMCCW